MATHALARRGTAALAALAALAPALASACPYCAGRAGGGVGTGIVLGSFVLLPFLLAWVVYRVMRAEARAGDARLFEVTDPHVVDRPIRQRPEAWRAKAWLYPRSRREAE